MSIIILRDMEMRRYSLYQILVLCGTREEKHPARISRIAGQSENTISTWAKRGIPYKHWNEISVLADVKLSELCYANCYALGTSYQAEKQKYLDITGNVIDKDDA